MEALLQRFDFFVKAQFSAVGRSPAPQKRVAGLSEWLGEKVISVTSGAGTSSWDFPALAEHLKVFIQFSITGPAAHLRVTNPSEGVDAGSA